MANGYGTPVCFTKEKNVWTLSAQLQFGPGGAVTLVQANSKGFCAVAPESVVFTGGVTASSSTLGTVSSFAGLFGGMTITGAAAGDIQASTTVGSWSAAGKTIVLSKFGGQTNTAGTFFATGGRVRLQLGTQAITQLNPYVKLLGVNVFYDVSTGSASGGVGVAASAPAATTAFVIDNKINIKTVPPTLATNSTDASIAIQFGAGGGPGTGFQAISPGDGEIVRVDLILGNSTAP